MSSNPYKQPVDQKLVLLIDDDPDEIEIYNYAISSLNFPASCIQANNRDVAMNLLARMTPDLIIIDYSIPVKNGLEVLVEIRSLPGLNKTPIVFCSTVMNEEIRNKAMDAGATFCIKKLTQLQDTVELLSSIFLNEK